MAKDLCDLWDDYNESPYMQSPVNRIYHIKQDWTCSNACVSMCVCCPIIYEPLHTKKVYVYLKGQCAIHDCVCMYMNILYTH